MDIFDCLHPSGLAEVENHLQMENLPAELMVIIFSYFEKKEKIEILSTVNKRWFEILNDEIKNIAINWPAQQNQECQKLIDRFPNLKNLELKTKIAGKDSENWPYFLPKPLQLSLDSFKFDMGTIEFSINPGLIQSKNWKENWSVTRISKIRVNPKQENYLEYDENRIIAFEIFEGIDQPEDLESVLEEILSLKAVTNISYRDEKNWEGSAFPQEDLKFVRIIKSILTRNTLKQINFQVEFDQDLDVGNEFTKNFNVEEISLDCSNLSFKVWKKVFQALPNVKKVKIVAFESTFLENLPVILRNISDNFKDLKSLDVSIFSRYDDEEFDVQKIRDCFDIIKDNFPMRAKGQLISKGYFDVFKSSKKQTNFSSKIG